MIEREDGVLELRPHVPVPVIRLSPRDSLIVAKLLLDPPEPNEKFRQAMEQYQRDHTP